ncbi:MAG TPA: chitobiase/beta-hexosaminidase C-terminal domain-containing protein [Candidatus Syntrophosphaera sp.]|nr:chitobiase/beta-hexosaminidase C-terminal domain-containing protein [Candidatus Syntrophosphaera sp.]
MKQLIYLLISATLLLSFSSCMDRALNNPLDPNLYVATPVIAPPAGSYQDDVTVSISCATSGASIHYTTDGNEPTTASPVYSDPVFISSDTSIKAKGFKEGLISSETVRADYAIYGVVATPSFNPKGGIFSSSQNVTISCDTVGATVYYSTDGSEPTTNSAVYSGPIMISNTTQLKAKGIKQGSSTSALASEIYFMESKAHVPGGTFDNGTSNVTLSSFWLGKYEVSQAEYMTIMGVNPSHFNQNNLNYPVEQVSWFDSIEYCNRLSLVAGLTPCYSYGSFGTNPDAWPPGWNLSDNNHTNIVCDFSVQGFRLLTEMEWMFAARGGTLSHDYNYSGSNDIDLVAWYHYNNNPVGTKQIGTKAPNELGINDMSGNVYEWVWDIYGVYPAGNQTDPTGPIIGDYHVLRGGYYAGDSSGCTVAIRTTSVASYTNNTTGFRVCRSYP